MLPKKGRRKIVVDGQTYYYFIKGLKDDWYYTAGAPVARLTIQLSDKEYHTEEKIGGSFTPSYIAQVIKEKI